MSRILLVGGGYIGMYTARALERSLKREHRLLLVTPENFMTYHPFLPEVASGLIDPRAVVVPLRRVLGRTELMIGEVERVEHDVRRAVVRLADGAQREVAYDVLIMGAGSWPRTLPVPGLAEHAVGFRSVAEAIWLRNRVISQLDMAVEIDDPEERRAALTFVFVGAGFAGVEALGELEDLARDAVRSYPTISRSDMRWVMVEAGARILPEFEPGLADYAARTLHDRGVEFHMQTRLASVEEGVVRLTEGSVIHADTVVWTAGVRGSPLGTISGFPVSDRGRIRVEPTLRIHGVPNAWAAGDVAAVPDPDAVGGVSPPTAQHALRQARLLAANVTASLEGRPLAPFRYRNKGMLCSLGHFKGVADPLGVRIKGFSAWFLHRTYHLIYMPTWGRRVRIALDWTVSLLFPRDIAQLGSLERPRDAFRRAAEGGPPGDDAS